MLLSGAYSCKKGENDPALSLKSRTARLTGEWKMTSSTEVRTNVNNGVSSTRNSTFDGTTMTQVFSGVGPSYTTTSTYSEEMTFEKDGTFKFTRTSNSPGENSTINGNGNWTFIGKSKTAELKNKEAISLSFLKFTDQDGDYQDYSGTFMNYATLIIDQLKSKEVIFTFKEAGTSVNTSVFGSWNNSWNSEGKMIYSKK